MPGQRSKFASIMDGDLAVPKGHLSSFAELAQDVVHLDGRYAQRVRELDIWLSGQV